MKKLLLGLGSIASVVAPVAAVISCGDDSKTPAAGTQVHTVAITGTALTAVTHGLNANLGITATNIDTVVAGDGLDLSTGSQSVKFAHYTKITFKNADTITLDSSGGTQAVKAGDTLVMGSAPAHRRASTAAPTVQVVLMTTDKDGNVTNMDLTDTIDASKRTGLETQVMKPIADAVEAAKPDAGNGAGSTTGTTTFVSASIDTNDATKAVVGLTIIGTMPIHLVKANIEPAMTAIKALSGIAAVTGITFSVTAVDTSANHVSKHFVVPVTAGKANDVDAIAAAAANVAATDATPDAGAGGTGTGTPTHKTVNFTPASGHASSAP